MLGHQRKNVCEKCFYIIVFLFFSWIWLHMLSSFFWLNVFSTTPLHGQYARKLSVDTEIHFHSNRKIYYVYRLSKFLMNKRASLHFMQLIIRSFSWRFENQIACESIYGRMLSNILLALVLKTPNDWKLSLT